MTPAKEQTTGRDLQIIRLPVVFQASSGLEASTCCVDGSFLSENGYITMCMEKFVVERAYKICYALLKKKTYRRFRTSEGDVP